MSSFEKVTKLSHKQFRAMLKKFRRKKKRQLLAKERDRKALLEQHKRESSPNYQEREDEKRRCSDLWDQFQERESIRKHKEWLIREEQAQAAFKKKQELLEIEKMKQEEERKRIIAEFEQQKFIHSQSEEEAVKIKSQKEGALKEVLSNLPQGDGPWHNPIAPQNYHVGTEREQCQFFAKTGCCRFGERCSRGHIRPSVSNTLLIKGMYTHFSIGQAGRDDFDTDDILEYEDKERYQDFENFYWDVLPEFKNFGKVVQFKVCCNHELHLRGNVYVQYAKEADAVEAYKSFNGRYYAGKQLTCEFSNVIKWRSAICGLFFQKRCPKGINCNFLHVFKNPGSEFWHADRDFEESARSFRSNQSSRDNGHDSSRHHSSSSHRRHRGDDYSPDYPSSHRSSRHHYEGLTDSGSDDEHSSRSSRSKHTKKHQHSSCRSHHKRKHRDSRSRSKSPCDSPPEKESSGHHKKHKKRKKSKKNKKEKGSGGEKDD